MIGTKDINECLKLLRRENHGININSLQGAAGLDSTITLSSATLKIALMCDLGASA
jgi:hypothetical protein